MTPTTPDPYFPVYIVASLAGTCALLWAGFRILEEYQRSKRQYGSMDVEPEYDEYEEYYPPETEDRHACPVVQISEVRDAPQSDALGLVNVDGWQIVVRKDEWHAGDIGIYVPPDYVVPDSPLFAWLKDRRIKVRKFRGNMSEGILIPMPEDCPLEVGDNAMEYLGITRYEPPFTMDGPDCGEMIQGPRLANWLPKYDVENLQKFPQILDGQTVIVTEKIHGANARYVFDSESGTFFAGSRATWKAPGTSAWWDATDNCPWIEQFCRANPDTILYGEIYGQVQNLRYGLTRVEFVAFDAFDLRRREWLDPLWLRDTIQEHYDSFGYVPVVGVVDYNAEDWTNIRALAEQDSVLASWQNEDGQLSEGVVIRPWKAMQDPILGNVKLKLVSERYYNMGE